MLVCNKIDLVDQRKVTFEEGEAIAQKNMTIIYCETSAKSGEGIEDLF